MKGPKSLSFSKFLAVFLGVLLAWSGAALGIESSWKSVQTDFDRDYPNSAGCHSYSLTVNSDGTYLARPCAEKPEPAEKDSVTPTELEGLNQILSQITSSNLNYELSCEDKPGINSGEYSLSVSLSPTQSQSSLPYELEFEPTGKTFTCSRGPQENLDQLSSYMRSLVDEYFPAWKSRPNA